MAAESKKSVLIVDSQPSWRIKLEALLCDEFLVTMASTSSEALDHLSKREAFFHVVITEISLDEGDENNEEGFEIIRRVREGGQNGQTIILTHHATVHRTRIAFRDYEVYDLVEKAAAKEKKDTGSPVDGQMEKQTMFDEKSFLLIVHQAADEAVKNIYDIDAFVIMDFDKKFDEIYNLIEDVTGSAGLVCKRSDQIPTIGPIMKQIEECISHSKMVIADLSGKNLNVYFEIGITEAKNRPLIMLAQDNDDLSRLLAGNRAIFYENSIRGSTNLRKQLREQIEFVQRSSDHVQEAPSPDISGKDCVVVVAETKTGKEAHKKIIVPALKNFTFDTQQVWDLYQRNKAKDVTRSIKEHLRAAEIIVIDLSGEDEDVYYLGGYAYGLNRYPIFLMDKHDEIPFDLRAIGKILYSTGSKKESESAKKELVNSIQSNMRAEGILPDGEATGSGNKRRKTGSGATKSTKRGSKVAKKAKIEVFLNHATEDKVLVRNLYTELKKISWIHPWLDDMELLPGQDWALEIDKAMREADACLVCISRTSIKKTGYVQAEIRKAEEQQSLRPQGSIYMIPVLLEKCVVPPNLRKYQWVNITLPGQADKIIKSLETLRKRK